MMDHNFDPYAVLLQLNERLNRLETQHNKLAKAYQKSQRELDIALQSLNHLQQLVLAMRTPKN